MDWDHMQGPHWWGMGWMALFWLLILVVFVLLIVWLVRSTSRQEAQQPREPSPEEILKRRYAQGEIDKEEYERRLKDLRS